MNKHHHHIDQYQPHSIILSFGEHVLEFHPHHRPREVRAWVESLTYQGCGNDCDKDTVLIDICDNYVKIYARINSDSAVVTWVIE